MAESGYTHVRGREVEGFQHGRDDYWYRPIVVGKQLYTDLVYMPSGGVVPPHKHARVYEYSYFFIHGQIEVTIDDERLSVAPGDAVHLATDHGVGLRNIGPATAIFLVTLSPSPYESLEKLRGRQRERDLPIKTPAEMERLLTAGGSSLLRRLASLAKR